MYSWLEKGGVFITLTSRKDAFRQTLAKRLRTVFRFAMASEVFPL